MIQVTNIDWNPSQKERKEMPQHCFLLPSERKFPYKAKVGGKWVISCKMLKDALYLANKHGYKKVAVKAKKYLQIFCKKGEQSKK